MLVWLNRILMTVIAVIVVVLAVTSLSTLFDEPMAGRALMIHLMAGGGLVVVLPLFALWFITRALSSLRSERLLRLGYWLLVTTGLLSIASVLLCMMPWFSTEQMHRVMAIHGYAGFATAAAWLVFLAGSVRMRRIQATRSATPG